MLARMFTRLCTGMEATDILLADMMRRAVPGRSYSAQEIADYTGMDAEEIERIEREALKKLRSSAENIGIISGLREELHGN